MSPPTSQTRPKHGQGRSRPNVVSRYLIGRGVEQVTIDRARGNYLDLPGFQIRLFGGRGPASQSIGMILREMTAVKDVPPVAIRLLNPEIDYGVAELWVQDFAALLAAAQRHE